MKNKAGIDTLKMHTYISPQDFLYTHLERPDLRGTPTVRHRTLGGACLWSSLLRCSLLRTGFLHKRVKDEIEGGDEKEVKSAWGDRRRGGENSAR